MGGGRGGGSRQGGARPLCNPNWPGASVGSEKWVGGERGGAHVVTGTAGIGIRHEALRNGFIQDGPRTDV